MSRPPTPGLFSSVLGYLTREVTDFVVSAAGGEPGKATPHVDARKERDGRSERERRKERKRRRVQSQAEGQVEGEDVPASGKAQRKRRSHEDEQYDASAEDGQKSSRRRISPPSPDSSRAGPSNVAPEPSTSKDAEPAPAPRRRKRRPSITMPGSLYPRTPSVEPDSPSHSARTPSPQPQPQPHSPSNPSRYVDYQIPLPPSRPSTPSQWVVSPPRGKRVGEATRRFSEDGDARLMLPKHPHSPNHRAEKSQSSSNAKGKGRERERELPAVFDSSDSSSSESDDEGRASPSPRARKITRSHNHDQENEKDSGGGGGKLKRTMSVGGIERELVAVRQAHAQKEAVWEDRDVGDSTVVQDERREYLERIQGLEAEVQRLRAELAKAASGSTGVPMPPPPPPPPPPLYFRTRIPTTPAPDALYAATRAQLRHAATPNEAPINPLSRSKIGKATVQLSGDKMAAFLSEVRNVRLRKVGEAPRDLERSRDFARGENLGSGLGKRKRVGDGEEEGEEGEGEVVRRLKRRFTMAEGANKPPFEKSRMDLDPFSRSFAFGARPASDTGSSSSSAASGSGSGLRREYGRVPSSVDGTDVTPSLASDNDAESLSLFEDRAVRTPPPPPESAPVVAVRSSVTRQHSEAILPEEELQHPTAVEDVDADVDPSPFRRTFPKTPLPSNARHSSTSDSDSEVGAGAGVGGGASPPMQLSDLQTLPLQPRMSEKARGKQRAVESQSQLGVGAASGRNGASGNGNVVGSGGGLRKSSLDSTKRKPASPLDRPTPPRARPPRRVPRASSPPIPISIPSSFDFSRREEEEEDPESEGGDGAEEEEEEEEEDAFNAHARTSTTSSLEVSLSASTAAREEIVAKSRVARSLIPRRVYGGGRKAEVEVEEVEVQEDSGSKRVPARPPTPPRAHQPQPQPQTRIPAKKGGVPSKGRLQQAQGQTFKKAVPEPVHPKPKPAPKPSTSTSTSAHKSAHKSQPQPPKPQPPQPQSRNIEDSRRDRRRTLEQELLEAAARVSDDRLLDLDLDAEMEVFQSPPPTREEKERERDVFEGKGTRSGKGFMAHGGAGGRPVRMGRGYVRGASQDDE